MKSQADKRRSDRTFSIDNMVFLHLQPYVQSSLAPRSHQKLCFKYLGPFKIIDRLEPSPTSLRFLLRQQFIPSSMCRCSSPLLQQMLLSPPSCPSCPTASKSQSKYSSVVSISTGYTMFLNCSSNGLGLTPTWPPGKMRIPSSSGFQQRRHGGMPVPKEGGGCCQQPTPRRPTKAQKGKKAQESNC